MMKTRVAAVVVLLSFMAAAASYAANPHLGTWKLNETKSKFASGMGKNTTVTYTEQKNKIRVTLDGMDKDGKATHGIWVGKFDGKAYPEKGNLAFDALAYKVVNDRTNDVTAMKGGKTLWTGTITVSKDGKSRTVIVNGTDEKGKKFTNTAVYDKQ
jgi:hypothetical protein